MLGYKTCFNKFKRIEIIENTALTTMELNEKSKKKDTRKITKYLS